MGTGTLLWADLTNEYVWAVLLVTFGFGMVSILTLFRVTLSRNSPRRRKRMAKLWILAMMAAAYAIAFQ